MVKIGPQVGRKKDMEKNFGKTEKKQGYGKQTDQF
jgi:hypothetical protein